MAEFDNLVLVDNETEPSRLLEFSTHAISTISTVLLDIEMYHVECAVIADEATINLMDVFVLVLCKRLKMFSSSFLFDTRYLMH